MIKFTIVGEKDLLVRRIQIAERVIEDQAAEIAQLQNELHDYKDQMFALRLKHHNKKANLSVVKIFQFPHLVPGV